MRARTCPVKMRACVTSFMCAVHPASCALRQRADNELCKRRIVCTEPIRRSGRGPPSKPIRVPRFTKSSSRFFPGNLANASPSMNVPDDLDSRAGPFPIIQETYKYLDAGDTRESHPPPRQDVNRCSKRLRNRRRVPLKHPGSEERPMRHLEFRISTLSLLNYTVGVCRSRSLKAIVARPPPPTERLMSCTAAQSVQKNTRSTPNSS